MHPNWRQICDDYMAATSYTRQGWDAHWEGRTYDPSTRPPTYLRYPDAVTRVELGEPSFPANGPDLWSVLGARRSKRNFLPKALTLSELNLLLWASQGVTADMGDYQLRTAPSSGALYPIETYLVVNRVDGLAPGIYHLDVEGWTLEGLRLGDVREQGQRAMRGQTMAGLSAVNFLWTAVLERCRAKYFERAYRYVWWDVGHVCENMLLAAGALGLGATPAGSWYDDEVHRMLGIDGVEHVSVLTASVGRVHGEDWRLDRRPPA
jgi:SagB-type dehydrogenase family enzyme